MTDRGELLRRIERLGDQIDPGLRDRDVERLIAGGRVRRRRRRVRLAGLAVAVAAGGWLAVAHRPHRIDPIDPIPAAGSSEPPRGRVWRFADGSVATPADDRTAMTVRQDSPSRIAVDLAAGRERFEVVPGRRREFVVRAGDVTVTVLGTIFSVEHVADRVGVSVERGQVRVDWGLGRRALVAGESAWFPPLLIQPQAPVAAAPRPRPLEPRRTARAVAQAAPAASPETTSPGATPAESAESLLAAADAARVGGRAREGAALLRRLLDTHRGDPRAPFAAFTLGRMLLMELGEPRAAAAAFAEARALAPDGALAEDALAREAEAWAKAGDTGLARARARDYLRLYPEGRRVQTVRELGERE
jgi:transmembrane sensor